VSVGWRGRGRRQGRAPERGQIERRVDGLYEMTTGLIGSDRVVFKAAKLGSLKELRADDVRLRALALGRIVLDDPTLAAPPLGQLDPLLDRIEEQLADLMARRAVEDRLERRVAEKMQERHEAYLREIKNQILTEDGGPENASTLRRLAVIEKLNTVRLNRQVLDLLKPTQFDQVIGQETAVNAVLAKVASPFPQHILLYGPPGTGKTTVARLALEAARAMAQSPFGAEAPFVEVDGSTLRWDPRDVANPLLGSVHDPIYQGARRDLAEGGVPEPKTGLVTEAHGGVLFIDEIGEMDPLLQAKLLKVLEEKRVTFESSYYDSADPQVPQYIKKLFEEGAPADFLLIGATTRDPDDLSPALRSRCAEIYFDPLSEADIRRIVHEAAERLTVRLGAGVAERIGERTTEGRKAIGLLADAYGYALRRTDGGAAVTVCAGDVDLALRTARLGAVRPLEVTAHAVVGRSLGLAVAGHAGTVLEIEAAVFPAGDGGHGSVRFNETAGSMARDSVFNAATVIRGLTGVELAGYDVHVNVVGGGRVDGPSAGTAVLVAVLSALTGRPVLGDVAMTGEVSLRGEIRPVGGIYEKVLGALWAGARRAVIPAENAAEAPRVDGIEVFAVHTVDELLPLVLQDATPPFELAPAAGGRGALSDPRESAAAAPAASTLEARCGEDA
jgi:ATP-dependent Lon protease